MGSPRNGGLNEYIIYEWAIVYRYLFWIIGGNRTINSLDIGTKEGGKSWNRKSIFGYSKFTQTLETVAHVVTLGVDIQRVGLNLWFCVYKTNSLSLRYSIWIILPFWERPDTFWPVPNQAAEGCFLVGDRALPASPADPRAPHAVPGAEFSAVQNAPKWTMVIMPKQTWEEDTSATSVSQLGDNSTIFDIFYT